ncbi:MAG TPA: hypothetical protein VLG38_00760 [Gammaproteobacteria bacterium]|nr:hypothetical protein [Gammaproteobacteria bacterium]
MQKQKEQYDIAAISNAIRELDQQIVATIKPIERAANDTLSWTRMHVEASDLCAKAASAWLFAIMQLPEQSAACRVLLVEKVIVFQNMAASRLYQHIRLADGNNEYIDLATYRRYVQLHCNLLGIKNKIGDYATTINVDSLDTIRKILLKRFTPQDVAQLFMDVAQQERQNNIPLATLELYYRNALYSFGSFDFMSTCRDVANEKYPQVLHVAKQVSMAYLNTVAALELTTEINPPLAKRDLNLEQYIRCRLLELNALCEPAEIIPAYREFKRSAKIDETLDRLTPSDAGLRYRGTKKPD